MIDNISHLWTVLHVKAAGWLDVPESEDILEMQQWLIYFESKFPVGCPCKKEWREAIELCPPPLQEGREAFFQWTIALHDRINVLLGKPIWVETSKQHILLTSLFADPRFAHREADSAVHKEIGI